ncbi:hypothetical protein [Bradyrhizobium sp. 21]|uniref:hypothetical protein n=1 Tax=Bradyrhizobium sp. 21 TaxID=2782666 RepID=UPI001FF9A52A|nr:hypothetical protein [Bradyrhizobium sp. 21]MCK1387663.1 hypothetical protein [Bradyrhizobium sp. 21]
MEQIYLSCCEYELGESRPLIELSGHIESGVIDTLMQLGLRCYLRTETSAPAMALASLARTLKCMRGIVPDLVLYCSTRMLDHSRDMMDFKKGSSQLGLPLTPLIGMSTNGCANFGIAVVHACDLIRARSARCVAVVTADTCARPADRLTANNSAILSDGAASCLISINPELGGFLVRGTSIGTDLRLHDEVDFLKVYRYASSGVRSVTKRALANASIRGSDIDRLVTMNVQPNTLRFYSKEAGFGADSVYNYEERLARNSHVFGADIIINLVESTTELMHTCPERACKPLLALSVSPAAWSGMVLQPASALLSELVIKTTLKKTDLEGPTLVDAPSKSS